MMSDDDGFELKTQNLDGLIKALKASQGRVRVGILGSKDARDQGTARSNATIGAKHEFGEDGMPVRSFLRTPIAEELQGAVDKSPLFNKDALVEVVKQGTIRTWLEVLGIIGQDVVGEAFKTGGFGKWPAWKTKGYESNTGQLLVDTQQLRNSITSDVK